MACRPIFRERSHSAFRPAAVTDGTCAEERTDLDRSVPDPAGPGDAPPPSLARISAAVQEGGLPDRRPPPEAVDTVPVPAVTEAYARAEDKAPTVPVPAVIEPLAPAAGEALAARRRTWAARRFDMAACGCLVICLTLWAVSLADVHVHDVATAGLGLVSVLPVTFWTALGVLTVSFCATVTCRPRRWPVLAGHVVVLIAILHATPAILYGTLRYSWAWKHVGVIDYIIHNGVNFNLGGILGPYQGWPGFFALNSTLTSASGLGSALRYAQWVLPFNDLLWVGPVILIARAFTSDRRLIWTAAWLFTVSNWIGQDYFSPQALAYFLYLTVIAICIRWFWVPGDPVARDCPDGRSRRSRPTRYALAAALLPMMAAIASSHQLTPFMLIAALTALALFREFRHRVLLPVAMTVTTLGWLAYGARSWLGANRSQLLQGLGLPWANASSHVVSEGTVPPDQVIIDWGVRSLSGAMAVLAVVGFVRYRRHHTARARRSWWRIALLAGASMPALAANSYGGEIVFRVYLFALPFLAVAAAAAFFPHPRAGRPSWTALVLMGTVLLLSVGYSLGNFGEESVNYFTPQEVAASEWLYRNAPPGALLVGADSNFPWAFVHYNWYSYTFLDTMPGSSGRAFLRTPVATVANIMKHYPSYLILTTSQAAEINMTGAWPAGEYSRLTHDLLSSGKFRVVYQNANDVILQLDTSHDRSEGR